MTDLTDAPHSVDPCRQPLVSVLDSSYHKGHYLPLLLEPVESQTYQRFGIPIDAPQAVPAVPVRAAVAQHIDAATSTSCFDTLNNLQVMDGGNQVPLFVYFLQAQQQASA